jgi:hypothetical protein
MLIFTFPTVQLLAAVNVYSSRGAIVISDIRGKFNKVTHTFFLKAEKKSRRLLFFELSDSHQANNTLPV